MRRLWLPAGVFGAALAVAGAVTLAVEVAAGRWSGVGMALPGAAQLVLVAVVVLAVIAGEAAAVRRRWWVAAVLVLPAAYAGALAGLYAGLLAPLGALALVGGTALAFLGARAVLTAPSGLSRNPASPGGSPPPPGRPARRRGRPR